MAKIKIVAIGIVLLALFVVFAYFEGIQYLMALVSGSMWHVYVDPVKVTAVPNCDGAPSCGSGPLKVLSFNVLCRVCAKEDYDPWDVRYPRICDVIKRYDADLMGLQELGFNRDLRDIQAAFPAYDYVTYSFFGLAYADCALFYRRDRFEVLDSGQMWLSRKPSIAFSVAWKPLSMPRYVNWAFMRQKSNGFRFLYINTHFDNNTPNKEPSAVLFAKTFESIAQRVPIIVTGDFNTDPTTQRYRNLKGDTGSSVLFEDTADLAPKLEVINNVPPDVTLPDMNLFIDPTMNIDHIFLAGPAKKEVTRYVQDATTYEANYRRASDHPSVYAEFSLTMP